MATVKLQDGKVILKDGKVSCSCCGGGCCMYPAQELIDGIYSDDDLPDNVSYNYNFNGTSSNIILNKSGSEYSGNIGEAEFRVRIIINALSIARWEYRIIFPPGGYGPNGVSDCLFFDRFQQPLFAPITDQFADTYTVTSCSYAPVIGASVTRVSLCVWQGTYLDPENPFADGPQNAYLIYCPGTFTGCGSGEIFENGSGVEVPYFYAAIDIGGSGGFFSKKTPNANIPSGSYAGEFSISFS